ncbi:hypothetical protein [Methylobacterium ajmalii]|jgi:hypothetical protein|uniref:hypothetical protein n=1 Tax=Methylobacterium ajmalii TaxID=2738439 RepID=UPI00190AD1F3|nr:hypothetical protein [Methylobacterium ajmalii]MBK3400433.1 hypothetical protein [Methylobacterium ajmalii]MBK3407525.1 hypothetical protein [Methylobacterium ajmalii]MBK3422127.1 hypothetical protein [Methylobacterium ajmalii]MBZ6416644.1 hypothetical protein [Methylobacterium sp.]
MSLPVVLLLVHWNSSGGPTVVTQRFTTVAACERFAADYRELRPYSGTPSWRCRKDPE